MDNLACVTEQTHDIRVYGLCDSAMLSAPHNFPYINYEPKKNSAYGQRPPILFAPSVMFTSKRVSFLVSWSSFVAEVIYNAAFIECCVFAAVQIHA